MVAFSSIFQSTPPARGATAGAGKQESHALHFNPRPPRGGRRDDDRRAPSKPIFQSTPPARGATKSKAKTIGTLIISIHAPREGGDGTGASGGLEVSISIHAPREGGDLRGDFRPDDHAVISIHAPREGGDCDVQPCYGGHPISIHAPREGGDGVFISFRKLLI